MCSTDVPNPISLDKYRVSFPKCELISKPAPKTDYIHMPQVEHLLVQQLAENKDTTANGTR
jgi:hypothetical protein